MLTDLQGDDLRIAARPGTQLQAKTFAQVARTDARRVHAVQPLQRNLQLFEQLFARVRILGIQSQHVGQAQRDRVQAVVQVAVGVERLDQHLQRGPVGVRHAHAGHLRAQVLLQRDLAFAAFEVATVVIARCGAGGRTRQLADAVEVVGFGAVLPVFALGGAEVVALDFGDGGFAITPVAAVAAFSFVTLVCRLAGSLGRCGVVGQRFVVGFQEGVLLEHLLDFLLQLQRRELQQPDRLLQLRRQRQVLRQADLQGRLHRR